MMDFKIEDPEGNEQVLSANDVVAHMSQAYQGVKLSPDGTTIEAIDPTTGEVMESDLGELVGEKYGKVKSFAPSEGAVDYNGVNKSWRAAIEALPNDPMVRKAYLQSKLEGMGVKDRKIIGEGEDYYTFNPQTGKYSALTNSPGLDMSDVAGFAPSLVRGLGSAAGMAVGGTLGSAAGPVGSVAGGAAGAGAGGFLADEGMRKVAGYFDKDFDSAMGNMTEEQRSGNRKEQAFRGAIDTATGGVSRVPGVASALSKLNPFSRLAQGSGAAAQGVGAAARGAGQLVAEPGIARTVVTNSIPGLGQVSQLGSMMRAGEVPQYLARQGGKVANAVANSVDNLRPQSASTAEAAKDFFLTLNKRNSTNAPAGLASKIERAFGGMSKEQLLQKRAGDAANKAFQTGTEEARNYATKATQKAGESTLNPTRVKDFYQNAGQKMGRYFDKRSAAKGNTSNYAKSFEKAGAGVGEFVSGVSSVGRGLENVAEGTVGLAGKALKHGGGAVNLAGRGLKSAGTVTAPIEGRVLFSRGAQSGIEELQSLSPEEQLKRAFQQKQSAYKY